MKKKNLNKLTLKKTAVSHLDTVLGGLAASPVASSNPRPQPVGTNVWSNCQICDSLRVTQCQGNACPNFTTPCGAAQAQPINGAV